MFKNTIEAINYIENLRNTDRKNTINRMNKAMELFDYPNYYFDKVIHITGSNGKGSTANYINRALVDNGHKTGLFTSPYYIHFNERIIFNDIEITDEEILNYLNYIVPKVTTLNNISFFEVVTIMALLFFRDKKAEYIIIEVGMGGLNDATNIFKKSLSIITNISLEHTKFLGDNKLSILDNKLGIVKENSLLITGVNKLHYINKHLSRINSKAIYVKPPKTFLDKNKQQCFYYNNELFKISMMGKYQVHNATLALKALETIGVSQHLKESFLNMSLIGRMSQLKNHNNIFIDGAHNYDAINNLVSNNPIFFEKKKIHFFISILDDKNYKKMIKRIDKEAYEIVFTSFNDSRNTLSKDMINYSSCHKKRYYQSPDEGFEYICGISKDDIIVITGSIHFISYIIKINSKK